MLPDRIRTALLEIVQRLDEAGVDYYIGGSAMLAKSGFDVSVGDIDVVVDGTAREVMAGVFPDAADLKSQDPWLSTWVMRTDWGDGSDAVAIDVIGDLGIVIAGSPARFPLHAAETVNVDGIDVPLGSLRQWYHLYRVHAPAKAELIASRLSDSDIVVAAAELGIGDSFSPTLIVRIGNGSPSKSIEDDMTNNPQSSIIEVASPTDVTFDAPGSEAIDLELLQETLEYIRPALQADGGDLVLLGTEEGKVTLQMVGACGGCPLSTMTLTAGIERIVKDRVPGVTEVVSV